MKRFFIFATLATLIGFVSCNKDDLELGDPPTEADAAFTFQASSTSANIIEFTATRDDVIALWDFGNGTNGKGITSTGTYPLAGTYTVTLTVYTSGGNASSSQDIVIAEDDLTLLDSPLFRILTGGSDNGGVKTWVIDSNNAGHFGVGPNPSSETAGDFPEFYQAGENEKVGADFYDDRYTFYLDAFRFDMVTNGGVYVNAEQASQFPGSFESPVGDYIAPFEDKLNESWTITTDDDTILTVSGSSFIGYNTGTNSYKVVRIEENELFLRQLDANNSELAWYVRLIPVDFETSPGGGGPDTTGGGGPDTTDTITTALPIDFETNPPVFESFGGQSNQPIANPDASGINTSSMVLETVKGNEGWAGIYVDIGDKLDFTGAGAGNLAVKVWAPATGTFRMKIENRDSSSVFIERDVMVTQAMTWEEISIDFSDASPTRYDRIALFPSWDVANAGTFYLDDIEQK